MHTFRVWAPIPKKVELALGQKERLPMRRGDDGWWHTQVNVTNGGGHYGFFLDDEGPFPDPRSPWQPDGVHGLSHVVNHSLFTWSDAGFNAPPLSEAVIYELHIGTFTPDGTFDSAIEQLDHLVHLGITHVELMPVNEFSGHHGWGYDGVDLYAPHQTYGGPEALKRLVNACHARGLAVLLDVVYNHLGPTGNYLGKFAPYFTSRYHTPWGQALNFDGPHSEEVRRFFCDNALMWLRDYHFDGLRLDAVHAICDESAHPFLEQLGEEVRVLSQELGRRLVLIPESDLNDPRLLWPHTRGGFALDAQWSDDFHHALHSVLTGERNGYYEDFGTLAQLAKALQNAYVYDNIYSPYRKRRHGRTPEGLKGHHFLGYIQNHDQVGNRACGDRLSHGITRQQLMIAAALVLTSPFVPMLFQGEEWGADTPFQYFTNHAEPELAKAVREGRRKEFAMFGWKPEEVPDPQSPETFKRSKLDWTEPTKEPHAALLHWYRRLIQLRKIEPALVDGRRDLVKTQFDEAAQWLNVERGPITIACNFSSQPQAIPLRNGGQNVLLTSDPAAKITDGKIQLAPESVILLKANT